MKAKSDDVRLGRIRYTGGVLALIPDKANSIDGLVVLHREGNDEIELAADMKERGYPHRIAVPAASGNEKCYLCLFLREPI